MRNALILAAVLALTAGAAAAQDISGSYVSPLEPSEIRADTTYTFVFDVWNNSFDAEWLTLIEVTFPDGCEIDPATAGYSNTAWSFGFIADGTTARWFDSNGGYGEIYSQEGGHFWVDAQVGAIENNVFQWHVVGDSYGEEPHEITGTFEIPLGTTALEPLTWGAVKGLYR